jgi:hypothetical protein
LTLGAFPIDPDGFFLNGRHLFLPLRNPDEVSIGQVAHQAHSDRDEGEQRGTSCDLRPGGCGGRGLELLE